MKLDILADDILNEFFGRNHSFDNSVAKTIWEKLIRLLTEDQHLQIMVVQAIETMNYSPQRHIIRSKKNIAELVKLFEEKRELTVKARRQYPTSYGKGLELAQRLNNKISDTIEEFINDPRRDEEEKKHRPILASRDLIPKVTLPLHVMLRGIVDPLLVPSLPMLSETKAMQTTAFLSGIFVVV